MATGDSDKIINAGPHPDPTPNVLNIVDDAVRRLNDINVLTKEFTTKLINAEVKRIDDLTVVQIKKLEDSLHDHKEFNNKIFEITSLHARELGAERELRLIQKFESLAMAISKAEISAEKRFESIADIRNTLSDQQRIYMPRAESNSTHESFAHMIASIEKRVDKSENIKQGAGMIWAYILGAVGLATGLITFLMNKLG